MAHYTVKQLARLSGVSVRALHHYDQIGLLVPSFLGGNRYRYYGREELERLQQILIYRELGVPLARIGSLIALKGSDRLEQLVEHRALLAQRLEQSRLLLRTIDATIAQLQGAPQVADKDLYQGFAPEQQAEYEQWLIDRYGGDMADQIEASRAHVAALGKAGMAERLAEGEAAGAALAQAFKDGLAPDDRANDALLARHHAWIAAMWNRECPPETYAGLADLYLEHRDFRTNLDKAGAGFTEWLAAAMKAYATRLAGA